MLAVAGVIWRLNWDLERLSPSPLLIVPGPFTWFLQQDAKFLHGGSGDPKCKCSKREETEAASLLKDRPRTGTMSLPLHSMVNMSHR